MEAMIDRAKLNYEKNRNNDIYYKLHSQISNYKKKVDDEELKLRTVLEYSSLKEKRAKDGIL